jgi:peptide/nickel transport system substrate-binding protein
MIAALIGLLSLVPQACGGEEEPASAPAPVATVEKSKFGGTITMVHRKDPPRWTFDTGTSDRRFITSLMTGAGTFTAPCEENNFEICPYLANSWEANADFTEWKFTIRDDAFWHDGTPYTAYDAQWWVHIAYHGAEGRKPEPYKPNLGGITNLAVDGSTLTISLDTPFAAYPSMFSEIEMWHPRHLFQPEIDKGNATVWANEVGYVGTGPWKFKKYDKGSIFQAERFSEFWQKDEKGNRLPYMDGIDRVIFGEPAAAFAAMRTGKIDTTERSSGHYLSPEKKNILQDEFGDQVTFYKISGYPHIAGMNLRIPPWNNLKARQALSLYVDRQDAINAIFDGMGIPLALWLPTSPLANKDYMTWPGWNPDTKEADRARAKELLAEAGFPNGFKTTLMVGERWVKYGEWLETQLSGLLGEGNVTISVKDSATYYDQIAEGNYEILQNLSSSVHIRHSPELLAPGWLSTNRSSWIKHDDKKADELFATIRVTQDPAQRAKLAQELEIHIRDNVVGLMLYQSEHYVAFRSHVKDFIPPQTNPAANATFVNVWLDK